MMMRQVVKTLTAAGIDLQAKDCWQKTALGRVELELKNLKKDEISEKKGWLEATMKVLRVSQPRVCPVAAAFGHTPCSQVAMGLSAEKEKPARASKKRKQAEEGEGEGENPAPPSRPRRRPPRRWRSRRP
jgi:hypothetical protein